MNYLYNEPKSGFSYRRKRDGSILQVIANDERAKFMMVTWLGVINQKPFSLHKGNFNPAEFELLGPNKVAQILYGET